MSLIITEVRLKEISLINAFSLWFSKYKLMTKLVNHLQTERINDKFLKSLKILTFFPECHEYQCFLLKIFFFP